MPDVFSVRPEPSSEAPQAGGVEPIVGEAALFYRGEGDGQRLVEAFRVSRVVLQVLEDPLRIVTLPARGLSWVPVFTDPEGLARFLRARGEGDREARFVTVSGAHVLDVYLPALPGPMGVVVDPLSRSPVVLPPVSGIVPEEIAVDVTGRRVRPASR